MNVGKPYKAVDAQHCLTTVLLVKGCPETRGSTCTSDREMVCSYRLSIQSTVLSGTVWLQFVMQVLTRGCELTVWEEGVVVWDWRWVP